MKINGVIVQPTVIGSGEMVEFVVREARSLGGTTSTVPLNRQNVQEFLPNALPFISWEEMKFNFPLRREDGKLREAECLEEGHKGDACVVYLTHALLTAGFTGNACYQRVADRERLVWTDGQVLEEVISDWEKVSGCYASRQKKEEEGRWEIRGWISHQPHWSRKLYATVDSEEESIQRMRSVLVEVKSLPR